MGVYEDRVDKIAAEMFLAVPEPDRTAEEVERMIHKMISLVHSVLVPDSRRREKS